MQSYAPMSGVQKVRLVLSSFLWMAACLFALSAAGQQTQHSLLFEAIASGDVEEVRTRLPHAGGLDEIKRWRGPSPFTQPHPVTPLALAAWNGHRDIARLLLEAGADADAACTEMLCKTPLMLAAWAGHLDVVELLLEEDADVEARDSEDNTPLHWAVSDPSILKRLLQAGADIEARNRLGRTPLLFAALTAMGSDEQEAEHLAAGVRTLLRAGADPDVYDADGATALGYASSWFSDSVVEALLDGGADPSIPAMQKEGEPPFTPLMAASSTGHLPSVRLLLDAGGDPDAGLGEGGPTALMIAREAGHDDIVQLLLAQGATDVPLEAVDGENSPDEAAVDTPPNCDFEPHSALKADLGLSDDEAAIWTWVRYVPAEVAESATVESERVTIRRGDVHWLDEVVRDDVLWAPLGDHDDRFARRVTEVDAESQESVTLLTEDATLTDIFCYLKEPETLKQE